MNIKGLHGNGYACWLYTSHVNLNNISIDVYYESSLLSDSSINFPSPCDTPIYLALITFSYRYMLGLAGIPSFVQFLGFVFMPESPRWLIINEREEYARRVLQTMRGHFDIDEEFDSIKNSYLEARDGECKKNIGCDK